MKRAMLGGATRGPVEARRQQKTIRFIQILLVLISGALMMLAGYSLGRYQGYKAAQASDSFDRPRSPSALQPLVLVLLGGITIVAAASLQKQGVVRMPTPARLDEFAGRAENVAIERAEHLAEQQDDDVAGSEPV